MGSAGKQLRMFNSANGMMLWDGITYSTTSEAASSGSADAVLSADEEKMFVLGGNSVHMVDCKTGERYWSLSPGKDDMVVRQLYTHQDEVFAIGDFGKSEGSSLFVSVIDPQSGDLKIEKKSKSSNWKAGLLVENNKEPYVVSLSQDGANLLIWNIATDKQTEMPVSQVAGTKTARSLSCLVQPNQR